MQMAPQHIESPPNFSHASYNPALQAPYNGMITTQEGASVPSNPSRKPERLSRRSGRERTGRTILAQVVYDEDDEDLEWSQEFEPPAAFKGPPKFRRMPSLHLDRTSSCDAVIQSALYNTTDSPVHPPSRPFNVPMRTQSLESSVMKCSRTPSVTPPLKDDNRARTRRTSSGSTVRRPNMKPPPAEPPRSSPLTRKVSFDEKVHVIVYAYTTVPLERGNSLESVGATARAEAAALQQQQALIQQQQQERQCEEVSVLQTEEPAHPKDACACNCKTKDRRSSVKSLPDKNGKEVHPRLLAVTISASELEDGSAPLEVACSAHVSSEKRRPSKSSQGVSSMAEPSRSTTLDGIKTRRTESNSSGKTSSTTTTKSSYNSIISTTKNASTKCSSNSGSSTSKSTSGKGSKTGSIGRSKSCREKASAKEVDEAVKRERSGTSRRVRPVAVDPEECPQQALPARRRAATLSFLFPKKNQSSCADQIEGQSNTSGSTSSSRSRRLSIDGSSASRKPDPSMRRRVGSLDTPTMAALQAQDERELCKSGSNRQHHSRFNRPSA